MTIKLVRKIPWSELEANVRSVPLNKPAADGSPILVYRDARISLRELDSQEVNPTSFYLLRSGLAMQEKLQRELAQEYGIDSLHLDGAVEIENEKGEIWTLTPPIIEVTPRNVQYQAKEGEISYSDVVPIQIAIINDGLHRVATARKQGRTFNGIFISGADPNFPFYAHPNGWDRITEMDAVPKTKPEKKFYSREDCYALYRNFGVLGCGAPRGTSK